MSGTLYWTFGFGFVINRLLAANCIDSEDSFELVEADSGYDEDADPHAQQGPTFMAQGLKMVGIFVISLTL